MIFSRLFRCCHLRVPFNNIPISGACEFFPPTIFYFSVFPLTPYFPPQTQLVSIFVSKFSLFPSSSCSLSFFFMFPSLPPPYRVFPFLTLVNSFLSSNFHVHPSPIIFSFFIFHFSSRFTLTLILFPFRFSSYFFPHFSHSYPHFFLVSHFFSNTSRVIFSFAPSFSPLFFHLVSSHIFSAQCL